MPSITFSYPAKAATRIKEANDFLNSLDMVETETIKQRLTEQIKVWVRDTLDAKANADATADRKALVDSINDDLDIS